MLLIGLSIVHAGQTDYGASQTGTWYIEPGVRRTIDKLYLAGPDYSVRQPVPGVVETPADRTKF